MMHEKNRRQNSNRDRLRVLAPDKWEEFKLAFIDECAAISSQSRRVRLDWDERPVNAFWIIRSRDNGPSIDTLRFTFEPSIPCILWQDYYNKKLQKGIGFEIEGANVLLVDSNKALILSHFVEQCLDGVVW